MANPDIGTIHCIFTGEIAPVRKDKREKLYYVSSAGMIKPNLPQGQKWMRDHVKLNDEIRNEKNEENPVTKNDEQNSSFWGSIFS